jgi:hypothetical protein
LRFVWRISKMISLVSPSLYQRRPRVCFVVRLFAARVGVHRGCTKSCTQVCASPLFYSATKANII